MFGFFLGITGLLFLRHGRVLVVWALWLRHVHFFFNRVNITIVFFLLRKKGVVVVWVLDDLLVGQVVRITLATLANPAMALFLHIVDSVWHQWANLALTNLWRILSPLVQVYQRIGYSDFSIVTLLIDVGVYLLFFAVLRCVWGQLVIATRRVNFLACFSL